MKKFILTYLFVFLLSISFTTEISSIEAPPSIKAEGAILIDGNTGQILYEKNAHRSLAPASVTKLMTALLTIENLSPDDTITFTRNAVMSIERGSSHIGMREGETITVNDALHGLLLMSANEVANGLAETISGSIDDFSVDMTERAAGLGALNTIFTNPHGLYDDVHRTTAYDMGKITLALLKEPYFLKVMSDDTYVIPETNKADETRYLSQSHKMLNPNKGSKNFREDVIAGKPGYTIKSGHTLVTVAERENQTLIAVTLNTDSNHLYTDTHALLDYGFDYFTVNSFDKNTFTTTLPITDGTTTVGIATLALGQPFNLQLSTDMAIDQITYTPALPEVLTDECSVGDQVGKVALHLGAELLTTEKVVVTDIELNQVSLDVQASESALIDVPDDSIKDNQPPKRSYLMPILIVLLILGILTGAYFYKKANTLSYSDYKKIRDEQKRRDT